MNARAIPVLICLLLLGALAPGADRQAERAYREGRRLQRDGKLREAFEAYQRAADLVPRDQRFVVAREMTRQQAAFAYVNAGERLMRAGRYADAIREFEQAADLDPSNDFTQQELKRAREAVTAGRREPQGFPEALPDERVLPPPLALHPRQGVHSWNLKGEPRALYTAVGAEYGIQFLFDDSLPSAPARLRLDDADFAATVRALSAVTKTFVAPLAERVAMVALDNPPKRMEFERLVFKTIDAGGLSSPEQMNEVANVLRAVLDMRYVQPSLQRKVISIRDTGGKVEAAERLVRLLSVSRPEVLLQVETLQVDTRKSRQLGLNLSVQSMVFKLSPLGTVQTGFSVPLPQLLGRRPPSAGGSRTAPLAAFGGGQSLFGLTLPGLLFQAALSESVVRSISTQTVRIADTLTSTLLIGERYPIVNASFSPIYFSSAIQQQSQAGTLINPFPSFMFEDLGVKLRVTARIHAEGDVTLRVEAQVRALTGENLNGVPTISNRETDQIVRVRDGESTLISGILSRQEQSSMAGLPLLGEMPVLRYLFGQRSSDLAETELIILLTPHILREPPDALARRETIPWPSNYIPIAR
jgi:general secretion pathway protein D